MNLSWPFLWRLIVILGKAGIYSLVVNLRRFRVSQARPERQSVVVREKLFALAKRRIAIPAQAGIHKIVIL